MKNQVSGFEVMSGAVANHRHAKTVLERMDANDEVALENFALQEIIVTALKSQTTEEYCIPHVNDDLDCEEATITDGVDPLAAIVDKKVDTDAAILSVRFVLKSTSAGNDNDPSPLCISVVPSFEDFEAALNNLLNQYKDVISTFGSLLKDDRILPLISTSKYDFMMLLEEEESASSIQECKAPWIPVQALLCDYTPYCVCTSEIRATLRVTLEQCCKQCSVSIVTLFISS